MEIKTSIKPYAKIAIDIFENEDFNIQEQCLLMSIISYYNPKKGYAYPSYEDLKRRSKIKQNRTLIKNLDSLEEKGFITKKTITGVGCQYYLADNLLTDYASTTVKQENKLISKEKNENIYVTECKEVVKYLNLKTGKKHRCNDETRALIISHFKNGFKVSDFKNVVDIKSEEWMNNPKMNQYLRPSTLFGNKFEEYLNQQQTLPLDSKVKANSFNFDFMEANKGVE